MKIYLCVLGYLLFLAPGLYAQAPYTGGSGDGYDRVSLITTTAIQVTPMAAQLAIHPQPSRRGEEIRITLTHPHAVAIAWQLLDSQGSMLRQGQWNSASTLALSNQRLTPGLYVWRGVGPEGQITRRLLINPS